MKNDVRVLFVHIPKTAGISVYNALADAIGRDHSIRFATNSNVDRENYLKMTENEIRKLRLLSGHFPLPFFLKKPISDFKLISVLRNPIDRELSAYFYVKTQPKHPLNTKWFKTLDLYRYLDHREQQGNINPQCMHICGERLFEKAKLTIEKEYFLVAPLDYIDPFINVLENKFQFPIRTPKHVNKTAFRLTASEVHPDIRKRFELLTEDDLKLYTYVKEKFASEFLPSISGVISEGPISGQEEREGADLLAKR